MKNYWQKTIEGGFETGLLRRASREGEGYQALKCEQFSSRQSVPHE
jgi:hypothetical protein